VKAFVTICALFALLLVPAMAEAATTSPAIPINIANGNSTFNGVLHINRFDVQNGKLVAVGTLSGSVVDRAGKLLGSVIQNVNLGVLSGSTGSCSILHLELGPLDANVLGLVIHLDRVVLDITGQANTLLGGLLCGVANLLNNLLGLNLTDLTNLTGLLNQVLAAL
jgi:hypothetical protein